MLVYDYGIIVNNFVGHYRMVNKKGEPYIISDEQYSDGDNEKKFKVKEMKIDEYGQKDFLIIALANVNIEKDESIIEFCNKYGLPYSTIPNLQNRLIDFNSDDIEKYDNMSRFEFCRHVLSARHFLNVKNGLNAKDFSSNTMLSNLLSLLLFERMGLYSFHVDKRGDIIYDVEPITYTSRFACYFHMYIIDIIERMNDEIELYKVLFYFSNDTEISRVQRSINNEEDKKEIDYWLKLIRFLTLVKSMVSGKNVIVNEYLEVVFRDEIIVSKEIEEMIKELTPIIFSDLINQGLSSIHPTLDVDENGKFFSRLSLPYQFDGIYAELLMMCSSGDQMCKCKNTSCGKFFISQTRYNKLYCCHECAVAAAKRRQRMRDKENPNRERLKPGFQSIKRSTNN